MHTNEPTRHWDLTDLEALDDERALDRAWMEEHAPSCKDCGESLRVKNVYGCGLEYDRCCCTDGALR